VNSNIIYDQKWFKLIKRSFLFRYFPFVDFVLGAGSMALGDVNENSDFDVIVGTKFGRLWTARFFCLAIYKLVGWRRKKNKTANLFCFNHFVTEKSYQLQPPYNIYWQELYKNLAPLFGDLEKIEAFLKSNKWTCHSAALGEPRLWREVAAEGSDEIFRFAQNGVIFNDLRFKYQTSSKFKLFLEKILSGKLGDWLENFFKSYQIKKIEKFLKNSPPGYKPRIIYNDAEVELHLDTRRLETIKNKRYS